MNNGKGKMIIGRRGRNRGKREVGQIKEVGGK